MTIVCLRVPCRFPPWPPPLLVWRCAANGRRAPGALPYSKTLERISSMTQLGTPVAGKICTSSVQTVKRNLLYHRWHTVHCNASHILSCVLCKNPVLRLDRCSRQVVLLASSRRLFQIRRIYRHINSPSCHLETASPYAVQERSPCYQPRPTLPSSAGTLAYRGLRAPADINSYQRSYTMGSGPTACGGSTPPDNPWAPIQPRLLQVPSPSGWHSPLRPPPSPTPCRRFPLTR